MRCKCQKTLKLSKQSPTSKNRHKNYSRCHLDTKKCFNIESLIWSSTICAQLLNIRNDRSHPLNKVADCDKVKQLIKLVLKTKAERGKIESLKTKCSICYEKLPVINKSVYYHVEDQELTGHIFCTTSILSWEKPTLTRTVQSADELVLV